MSRIMRSSNSLQILKHLRSKNIFTKIKNSCAFHESCWMKENTGISNHGKIMQVSVVPLFFPSSLPLVMTHRYFNDAVDILLILCSATFL